MSMDIFKIYKLLKESINNINVEENQNIIVENKYSYYAYLFARDVKGADIKKSQQLIIDCKDFYSLLHFAANVKDTDIQILSEFVLHSGNQFWIRMFYENIPHDKFDTSRFETYLTFM